MYISKLSLNGFKSFGQKTQMSFGEGITGVVGPNGCGKTNIVDALRWVLGEQKLSVLRSGRMEEIIFNGSRNHRPSGMCEVTLTIHNDKSKLPVEFTDVEITRRLYRDGESEYLLNQNPCRRKDIMDLFMDTGMGSGAYSVIELKMIDAILGESGDERRHMFEEAAGINKYRQQRAATYRKLEATRGDLERIGDIIAEVDGKVQGLGLQLKRFERHKRISAELQQLELDLATRQIQGFHLIRNPLQEALAGARRSHQDETQVISQDETQLADKQREYGRHEEQLAASRRELEQAVTELNELQQQQVVAKEQLRATGESLARFEREREAESKGRESQRIELARLEEELSSLAPILEEKQAALETRRAEEAAVNEQYQDGEQRLQAVREKKFSHQQLVSETIARRDRSLEIIGEKSLDLERLEETVRTRAAGLKNLDQRQAELTTGKAELVAGKSGLADDLESVEQQLADLVAGENKLQEEHNRLDTASQVMQSRLDIYSQLIQQHEGYPDGVREVLARREDFPGLRGVAADLLDVAAEYAQAVETALGLFAACLVVDTESQAQQLLDRARDQGFGRLAIIPLDRLKPIGKQRRIKIPRQFTGQPLAQLISYPPGLEGLFERLLEGVFFMPGNQPAPMDLPPGMTVVTAAGDLYGAVSVLAHSGPAATGLGNDMATGPASLVGRSAEIERLQAELDRLAGQEGALRERLAALERERGALDVRRTELKAAVDAILGKSGEIDAEIAKLGFELQRGRQDLDELQAQAPNLRETITGLEAASAVHEKEIADLKDQESGLERSSTQAQEQFQQVRDHRDRWQQALQESRLELLNLENQREKWAAGKLALEANLEAAAERIARLEEGGEQARRSIEELTVKLSEAEAQEQVRNAAVTENRVTAERSEVAARASRDEVSRLEAQIREQQHSREAALNRQQELELNVLDLQQQEQLVRSRIQELYAVEVPDEPDEELPDEPSLTAAIGKIQASLERIGPINMAVGQEYEEQAQRQSFLTEQRDDLVAAEASLLETIRRIDHQAREQFRETYDQIRHHFKQTFNLFFDGGVGDLRLIGDPDPLEAGLEIVAQPPGKNTRSLRSLSAGEKALTAIALLFAIYLVKPSPFCILDEVDAPLDDMNIGKFSRVIKQFSRDTQFIIVTHNKLTMQQADYLYGVTMEEEGLSRLVSVSLEQHAA
ncbi:MAG: chromosome segregation protein SMC [Candidatus Marinimicrobia bacterium]|nr:chromosome segregation protein SMC [Candidatus Neomarinimicrobiota bacterium]